MPDHTQRPQVLLQNVKCYALLFSFKYHDLT